MKELFIFYSQSGEDKYLYEKYFYNKRNLTCVELGATDGLIYSNTLFFENTLDWQCVLIEPQADMFKELLYNRPNCKCYNYAVTNIEGTVKMICRNDMNANDALVTSIESSVTDSFKNQFGLHKIIECKTQKFSDIMTHAGITRIDFLSLDVEGYTFEGKCPGNNEVWINKKYSIV